jgi:hypothetical protein
MIVRDEGRGGGRGGRERKAAREARAKAGGREASKQTGNNVIACRGALLRAQPGKPVTRFF